MPFVTSVEFYIFRGNTYKKNNEELIEMFEISVLKIFDSPQLLCFPFQSLVFFFILMLLLLVRS